MNEKKPCVLAGATPDQGTDDAHDSARPCALLCADPEGSGSTAPVPAPVPAPAAPREDESADPVGDGHSDAEWAARHPPNP